ncbi:MAG: tetratricopeptide repeat protein [Candidatus Acidoferrales bacterium]
MAQAKADFERDPHDPEAIIWLGRRTAYLGRYREAIAIYSNGIQRYPSNAKLYRHRGHRYLTVRELDKAIADLEKAANLMAGKPDEVEPDGMPNPKNIPRSTTQSNIWYHLGLAYYVRGDFVGAHRAFATCLEFSKNDDMIVATSYWLYLTLRRLDRDAEAKQVLRPIHGNMDVIENFTYHQLLLLYKGKKSPESLLECPEADEVTHATLLYGLGSWYLVAGQTEKAKSIFEKIIKGKQWPAFGFLAAEAELTRQQSR